MTDPVTAKALESISNTTGKAIDGSRELGAFIGRALGTLPEDAIGLLGGDLIGQLRCRNLDRMREKTERLRRERRVEKECPLPLTLALPLFQAAQDEGRDDLQELWARLLLNATDPERNNDLRIEFIETIKRFHPRDAALLTLIAEAQRTSRDSAASHLHLTPGAVEISILNLLKLGCIARDQISANCVYILDFGRELLKACS